MPYRREHEGTTLLVTVGGVVHRWLFMSWNFGNEERHQKRIREGLKMPREFAACGQMGPPSRGRDDEVTCMICLVTVIRWNIP